MADQPGKDKAMTFKFRNGIREMLQVLAEEDRRNVTNYLEVLIEKQYKFVTNYGPLATPRPELTEEQSREWDEKFLRLTRAGLEEREREKVEKEKRGASKKQSVDKPK